MDSQKLERDELWLRLAVEASKRGEPRPIWSVGRSYEGWVLCPREHAQRHLRVTSVVIDLDRKIFWSTPREIMEQLGRYFPGDDLVWAIGDIQ